MIARRFLKSSSSIRSLAITRTFTSTSSLSRTPALADITPAGVKSFDAKQKEFRERIAEQKNKSRAETSKYKSESSSPTLSSIPPAPTAPDASNASTASNGTGELNAGSSADPVDESERKVGKLSSLIYGTKEGRDLDREIEHSFSQVLARGKYVHSIVFHEVKPDKVDEYTELVGSWYPKMAGMEQNKVHLVGSWRTEVGDCDTFGKLSLPSVQHC